ncbi:non-hydrolyzing UDP-N-acetylglucosamine 2-epimerase [Saliphagus sp. GCM10025334]
MHVCTVVGARPQFVKAAVVSPAVRERGEETLIHTGQHYDEELSDVFFDELEIPTPDYNLGVGSGTHGAQTAEMITGIERILERVSPDVLLLYGDTNSTLAGAIVGSKADVTVAHVEGGLRSYNREMPEEVNRVVTDHTTDLTFAPSERAEDNLAAEGVTGGVHVTGDVMYDVLLQAIDRARERSTALETLDLEPGSFVLATVHRASNTDDRDVLESIVDGLASAPYPVVFPAHPRTVSRLESFGLWERTTDELEVIDPVGYLDFIRLVEAAERVATDSGGVQKEAFFLETPCVTLRRETEWVETVACGWNELVGPSRPRIERALERDRSHDSRPEPYGDGNAAERIADLLETAVHGTGDEPTLVGDRRPAGRT